MPRAAEVGRRVALAVAAFAVAAVPIAHPAAADPTSARAGLAVGADPPVLAPGHSRVRLRVDGCGGAPSLATNVGAVADLRVLAPGRAAADYLPPAEARPQVAIVSASCGDRHGWTVIPIVGRGVAIARTEPGAAISVTIGARSFGPVAADGEGVARVPVEVAPGVRVAYHGEKPLDLRVPPASHVHVAVESPALRADREEILRVRIYAVTESGVPRAGAPIRLGVSAGALSPPEEIAPGVTAARWTLPPGRAGEERVLARIEDDPGPPATAIARRAPGPPARLEVAPDRARAVAGEAPLQLDVRVLDSAGNLTPAQLRVDPPGMVLDARPIEPGRFAVGLDVPERLDGRAALEVTLRAGDAVAAGGVPLAAGPAAQLSVEPPAPELLADGKGEITVRVTLHDRYGNAVVGEPPAAATALPADVSTALEGESFRVTVRPHRILAPAEDAVTIAGAGRTERLRVALEAPAPRVTLAARAGYLASAGGLRSAWAGAEASVWPDAWRGLGAAIEAATFAFDRTDGVAPGLDVRGRARYFPLLLSARWRSAPSRRTVLLAGGGAALAPVTAEVRIAGQPPVRENAIAAGAHAALGAGVRLGAGVAFLEARALWLAGPGMDALRGDVVATGLVAGWSHGVF